MAVNLRGKSYLKLLDFTPAEIRYLLDLSKDFKSMKRSGVPHKYLDGKNIVLLFEKTSTRTRCSFEVAGRDLGMGVTYLDPGSSQMGKKESIPDTARVLGRMYDGIEYRGYSQQLVEELAKYSGVPVWNGLTDQFHPTQMLADLLTIEEKLGRLKGVNFTYMGDARNNMGNSLMVACAKMGLNFTACAPKALFPAQELVDTCRRGGKQLHRHPHRRRKGGHRQRRRYLHRHMGIHGRAGWSMGRANKPAYPLSGKRRRHEKRQGHRHIHALPPLLPRYPHHHRGGDSPKVRHIRDGGHGRGVRGQAERGV